jgi:hypothetical protein
LITPDGLDRAVELSPGRKAVDVYSAGSISTYYKEDKASIVHFAKRGIQSMLKTFFFRCSNLLKKIEAHLPML